MFNASISHFLTRCTDKILTQLEQHAEAERYFGGGGGGLTNGFGGSLGRMSRGSWSGRNTSLDPLRGYLDEVGRIFFLSVLILAMQATNDKNNAVFFFFLSV